MEKKLLCLSLVVLFGFTTGICLAKYSGGDGSESTPYRISNAYDMNDIGLHQEDWVSHFVMVNDVNLAQFTGTQFNIIGLCVGYLCSDPEDGPFTGVFDGNGQSISNFTYESTNTNNIGLFGYVDDPNAIIKDLTLIEANVDGGQSSTVRYAGSLVGWLRNGTVTDCYTNAGSVSGYGGVGGLVGNNDGTISKCCATATVEAVMHVGGLAADNNGMISNCYAKGNVSGNVTTGGLVGFNDGAISNCYAAGVVDGVAPGGLVGAQDEVGFDIIYTKCFWDSDINPDVNGIGNATDPNVIGKSTAEMQKESTFTGWDFIEIWNIGENQTYPSLRLYPAGDLNHDGRVDGRDLAIIANRWLDGI